MKKKQKAKSEKKPDLRLIAYYAHSMQKYGSFEEKKELNFISKLPGICKIINPALIEYEGIGMQQYFEIIDECNVVIFSEYKEHLGKGVHSEIKYALINDKPVFLLRGKILYECKDEMCRIVNPDDWKVMYARVILPEETSPVEINQDFIPFSRTD